MQKTIAAITVALLCLLIYLMCRCFVDYTHSFLLSIAFVFGSSVASTMGAALWSLDFETIFILVVLLLLVYHEQQKLAHLDPVLMGFLLFSAYLCRPTAAVFVAVILGYLFIKQREIFLPTLLVFLVFFAGLVIVSLVQYHHILSPYNLGKTFYALPSRFLLAVYAQLLSPSRGILIFSPFLLIAVVGAVVFFQDLRRSLLFWALLVWVILHIIVVSLNPNFWGGYSYGSRLLADAIPGMIVLSLLVWRCILKSAAVQWREAATSLLFVLLIFSVFVNTTQGLYNSYTAAWDAGIDSGDNWQFIFDWQHPQFLASPQLIASRNEAIQK